MSLFHKKKQKTTEMASSVTLSASDAAEYDQHIKHLQRSYHVLLINGS